MTETILGSVEIIRALYFCKQILDSGVFPISTFIKAKPKNSSYGRVKKYGKLQLSNLRFFVFLYLPLPITNYF